MTTDNQTTTTTTTTTTTINPKHTLGNSLVDNSNQSILPTIRSERLGNLKTLSLRPNRSFTKNSSLKPKVIGLR